MADNLVIVESPAKAKTISKFLGGKYKVVASNGHIRDLPKSQIGVDEEHDFAPKYITLRGRGDVLEKIRKEAKESKKVYLATDPDREGEAISWHLAKILHIDESSKCRIVFNEITQTAVKNSIKNVRSIDMNLVEAQQARRILDRLVGYNVSPVLWKKVQKGLSAGRVQSVATRIICDREDEINAFVAEEYWTIAATLQSGKRRAFEAKYVGENGKKRKLTCEQEANDVLLRIKDQPFIVGEIRSGEKKRHAAPPFTTSSLQQEASRKLGFTTKRTMMVAQQLYEGVELGDKGQTGVISYIRTDSVRVAKEAQDAALAFIGERFGAKYAPATPNVYRGRSNAQDAHEAIRPTDIMNEPKAIKAFLSSDQFKLYKLVYERFLSSQMAEASYLASQVLFDANGCTFQANGVQTLFDGFTAVYTEGRDEQQETEVQLPPMQQGERFDAKEVAATQRFTSPPPRFTEATLVKTLEERGIGRPSTYSPTITTIVDRGYVMREKKTLVPTDLGFTTTKFMKANFPDIVDVKFTEQMEAQLDGVENAGNSWVELLHAFYKPFLVELDKAKEAAPEHPPVVESDVICEKCGARMIYRMGRFGKFLACPNFPECRNTKAIVEKLDVPCPKCGAAIIKRKGKKGKFFYGCEAYPNCDFVSWDKPVSMKCPKCGGMMVQKIGQNGSFIACMDKNCNYIHRGAAPKKHE